MTEPTTEQDLELLYEQCRVQECGNHGAQCEYCAAITRLRATIAHLELGAGLLRATAHEPAPSDHVLAKHFEAWHAADALRKA